MKKECFLIFTQSMFLWVKGEDEGQKMGIVGGNGGGGVGNKKDLFAGVMVSHKK